jgi:hypothetical protein
LTTPKAQLLLLIPLRALADGAQLQFTSNTHITAIASNWEGNTLAGHQYDAGTIIYGVFTSIQLQSGHCVAYRL